MDVINERGEDSSKKCDLPFSFDFDINNVQDDFSDSESSETTRLDIDVSEIDDFDSTNTRIKTEALQEVSVLNDMEEEIQRQLDAKAAKTNLTASNVKDILKHLITNKNVIAMLNRKLNKSNDDDEVFNYERKLTRSKAKEVQTLIENELSEDTSDEEYKPDHDQQSDDEMEADNSFESDEDSRPSTPAIPADTSTSKEEQNSTDIQHNSEGVFENPGIPHVPTEDESIGQRTRSKLSLSETPLAYIEQVYVPPDFTTDMNDYWCELEEDINFFQNFALPLPQEVNVEDDPIADTEYNFLGEDETDLLDKEELRVDKAVKVTRKEFMADCEEVQKDDKVAEHAESQESTKKRRSNEALSSPVINNSMNATIEPVPVSTEPDIQKLLNVEQYLLLRIQMRQHVQLMAQHFLMSYNHPEHHKCSKSCKDNLESVKYLSNGPYSAFNVNNISPALKLVSDWVELLKDEKFAEEYFQFVSQEIKLAQATKKGRRIYAQKFHPKLEQLMIESKALTYPHLLPHMFCRSTSGKTKYTTHFTSEQNLIALGLEQFYPHVLEKMNKKWPKSQIGLLNDVVHLIRTYLLPCRKQSCLVHYIKQSYSARTDNPIKQYRETGKAPRTIHCISLESNLISPKEQPIQLLPERWQTCVRNLQMNKKSNNQRREKTLSTNLVQLNNEINPGVHILNPIINMMPTVSFQNSMVAKKKPTSEPPPIIKVETDPEPEEILPDIPETYYTLENETQGTENQTSRLPQLRKTTPRLAKTRSAQNIKSMTQVVTAKEVSANALKTKGKSDSSKNSEASTSSSVKGDDEDEIAELMLASTTIKKNAASRKKAKQARELENLKRLLESENELNVDERATKFAASYLQKLHATLESTDPETFRAIIKLYLDYSEKLENIIQTEHDNELKTDESRSGFSNEKRLRANIIKAAKDNLAIGLYREVTAKLADYPDMCSDFLLFLNSHQAAMIDKSVDWMMLQKMQEFVHVAQVYFAKQPSRLAKVMQSIAQLAAAPHTLKNVHEVMGPVLKGYPVVMDMFLQVFPDGKPPESLFVPQLFESVTCPVGPHDKTKVYAIDAAELYEHIELPVSTTQEDPYGGDNCKCNCHDVADPKLKTASEHCASCGTRKKRSGAQKKTPYTVDDVKKAIEAVKAGQSIRSASKSFNVPVATLHSRVKGTYSLNVRKGPATVFTEKEEQELVDWIFRASSAGFPITKHHLFDSIQMIVKKTNRVTPFTDGMPSKHWYKGFLRRNPKVAERMCQNIVKSRAKVSEKNLRWWFGEIRKDLEPLGLLNISPNRIYNLDESAFFLCPKGKKVLVRKRDKAVHNLSGNDKECYTALIGGNAAGQLLPTMVVYNNERIPPLVAQNFPDEFVIGKSETGWMVSETFYMYMTSVFYPWCVQNEIEFPVIVYVDGHSSHITKPLSDFCVAHKIELVALYPNATHIMQPMDVTLFHLLKTKYRNAIRKWRIENDGALLTKVHFAGVLKSALDSLDLEKIFGNGFKRCGLSPFSEDAINYTKLLNIDTQLEVQKDQTFCEPSVEVSSTSDQNNSFFERYLDADILTQFKNHDESLEWTGSVEVKELYKFWLRCQQSEPRMSDQSFFLNGRIYLQTSEGLRPAKITFPGENEESLENIARVSLKPAEKLVLAPSQPKRRRKSSKNDPSTDEVATKQPTFKVSPVKEGPEEATGDKIGTKSKRGPRSPPKTVQPSTSGIKKPVSKSKREKRAEKRDAKQEQKSQNSASETDSIFEMKSPQYEEFPNHSFVKEEILTDDDEKEMGLDKNDVSSDSESSTNCELEESVDAKSWSREEDAFLLQSIKKEYSEQTFVMISEKLANRTVQQVKDRCFMLLDLLQKLS